MRDHTNVNLSPGAIGQPGMTIRLPEPTHALITAREAMAQREAVRRIAELSISPRLVFPDRYPSPSGTSVKKKSDIQERAWELLKDKIGEKKFGQLNNQGYFAEKGKHGIYHFHKNDSHGVRFIQEINVGGKKRPLEWTLCIQSAVADMPQGDVILARWMELKADEDKFQKTSNWRNVKTVDEAVSGGALSPRTRRTTLPMVNPTIDFNALRDATGVEEPLRELGIDSHRDLGISTATDGNGQYEVYQDEVVRGNQRKIIETDKHQIDAAPDPMMMRFESMREAVNNPDGWEDIT